MAGLAALVGLHVWFPRTGGPRHNSYSASAEGKKAFVLLARRTGIDVERNHLPLQRLLNRQSIAGTLCLLGPARMPTDPEWDRLLRWVGTGGRLLLVAPAADRGLAESITIPGLEITIEKSGTKESTAVTTSLVGSGSMFWRSSRTFAGLDADRLQAETLVEVGGEPQAVRAPYGAGEMVVVASDFVFSNQSLAWDDGGGAELAIRLLAHGAPDRRVLVDESLNDTGTPEMVGVLLEPPLRPLTLQLLIGLLVFAWWGSRRFGPLQAEPTSSRHNIVDHTDTLGVIYYASGRGGRVLESYLKRLDHDLGLGAPRSHEERILAPIAARLGVETERIRRFIHRAREMSERGAVDRRTTAGLIRRLARIRQASAERPRGRLRTNHG